MRALTALKIKSLQMSLRPVAETFVQRCKDAGIEVEIVQGHRSPQEQQALKDGGKGVTKAGALLSFHNYGLAFDVCPVAYLGLPDWNPSGPLWQKIGLIGEALGLSWGGRWKNKDLPHFEARIVGIAQLKDWFLKTGKIMPVEIKPSPVGVVLLVVAALFMTWAKGKIWNG